MSKIACQPAHDWEGFFVCEAENWHDLWRMVCAMHHAGNGSVHIMSADADVVFAPFLIITSSDGLWILRDNYPSPDGLMLRLYGQSLEVEYSEDFLRYVQVEFPVPDREDPPPAFYWLPRALRLQPDDASLVASSLTRNEHVPYTAVQEDPNGVRHGHADD